MDGDRGDMAEFVEKKRNTDYDFPPPYTNKFVWAENDKSPAETKTFRFLKKNENINNFGIPQVAKITQPK